MEVLHFLWGVYSLKTVFLLVQSPVEDRVQVEGIGQCFVSSMHASRMPASQTLFPSPLLGLDTQTRPGE